jgi:geranylgeranyl diphosphate synthase type I
LGAIVAGDDAALVQGYREFGERLGMAFQIQDDILGAWGDEKVTGKSAARDILDKKKTLPVVYVMNQDRDRPSADGLVDLYQRPGPLDEEAAKTVLEILDRAGGREYAEEMAESYFQQALQSLEQTRIENDAQSHLRELAASLLGRHT